MGILKKKHSYEYSEELSENIKYTICRALEKAVVEPEIIDTVLYTSSNNEAADKLALKTLKQLFSNKVDTISVRKLLGDYIGANTAVALGLGFILLDQQYTIVKNKIKLKQQTSQLILSYTASGSVWVGIIQNS